MDETEFEWIKNLNIDNEKDELIYALKIVNLFLSKKEMNFDNLKNSIQLIFFYVDNEINLTEKEIRIILRYIRKLFFMDLNEDVEKKMHKYVIILIRSILKKIYSENHLENSILQTSRRCLFLNCLFADFIDDVLILGISKYDYTFAINLIILIQKLTKKLVCSELKNLNANFYFIIIDLLDKLISKWSSNSKYMHQSNFKINFINKLKSQLILLVSICKINFRLICLSLINIIDNLKRIIEYKKSLDKA